MTDIFRRLNFINEIQYDNDCKLIQQFISSALTVSSHLADEREKFKLFQFALVGYKIFRQQLLTQQAQPNDEKYLYIDTGVTPAHIACANGLHESLRILVGAGGALQSRTKVDTLWKAGKKTKVRFPFPVLDLIQHEQSKQQKKRRNSSVSAEEEEADEEEADEEEDDEEEDDDVSLEDKERLREEEETKKTVDEILKMNEKDPSGMIYKGRNGSVLVKAGATPLMITTLFTQYDCAERLLSQSDRVDPDARDRTNTTPLQVAVKNHALRLVTLLVQHGADARELMRDVYNYLTTTPNPFPQPQQPQQPSKQTRYYEPAPYNFDSTLSDIIAFSSASDVLPSFFYSSSILSTSTSATSSNDSPLKRYIHLFPTTPKRFIFQIVDYSFVMSIENALASGVTKISDLLKKRQEVTAVCNDTIFLPSEVSWMIAEYANYEEQTVKKLHKDAMYKGEKGRQNSRG